MKSALKIQSWLVLMMVVLLAVGCSTQVDTPPVVEERAGTEAPATVTLLDEGNCSPPPSEEASEAQ